jgi:hypothetical protein
LVTLKERAVKHLLLPFQEKSPGDFEAEIYKLRKLFEENSAIDPDLATTLLDFADESIDIDWREIQEAVIDTLTGATRWGPACYVNSRSSCSAPKKNLSSIRT